MTAEKNMPGQALALDNLAQTYECLANLSNAAETLEAVCFVIYTIHQNTIILI